MGKVVEPPKGTEDPRPQGPKEFSRQQIPVAGSEKDMKEKPDHGEESYRGFGRLKDKVALITGGDSGIGRAVAIAYAREGADVVISYWKEDEDAKETVQWVERAGRKGLSIRGDIGDLKHCQELADRVFKEFGKIDILVNNAAYQVVYDGIEEWPIEEFERTFRTNVFGMFYLCKAAMPRMKPGSVIINTSSIQAYRPNPQLLAYAPTKAAIVSFTKALAQLGGERGIRVNSVAPGPVWTPLIPSSFDEEKVEKFGSNTVFGRAAQPAEMAPAFVFLATTESMYMTGEVVALTGGQTPY
jgi:NAD(P)-dependent dehydrogenase (short-subunit alcohol dehydrogenase family)